MASSSLLANNLTEDNGHSVKQTAVSVPLTYPLLLLPSIFPEFSISQRTSNAEYSWSLSEAFSWRGEPVRSLVKWTKELVKSLLNSLIDSYLLPLH